MDLSITVTSTSGAQGAAESVVSVSGEVDVSNADQLRDAVNAHLADGAPTLVVDLSQVPYIDSTGIGVLVGAAHRASEQDVLLKVARPQKNVARVLGLLGVSGELHITE